MPICAEGHPSVAEDFCDVCGSPIGTPGAQPDPTPDGVPKSCPECGAAVGGRFCEACGHDSALPAPPPAVAAPARWTVVVAADREFYERVLAREGPDTVDFPQFFPERHIGLDAESTLIGRRNREQGVEPGIDLGLEPADRGVSTQHAVLRVTQSGVSITDLGSTNGTSLNGSDDRLAKGAETPLSQGDRIHIGAWTTIMILRDD
jgi:FHA domain